jgi:hypothetical protein
VGHARILVSPAATVTGLARALTGDGEVVRGCCTLTALCVVFLTTTTTFIIIPNHHINVHSNTNTNTGRA